MFSPCFHLVSYAQYSAQLYYRGSGGWGAIKGVLGVRRPNLHKKNMKQRLESTRRAQQDTDKHTLKMINLTLIKTRGAHTTFLFVSFFRGHLE